MKSAIDRRLSALCVPDDMAQRIQAAAQKKRPRVIRFRRPLAVAAVFCLILACSMGVLATTVPACAKSVCHSGHTDIFHAAAH